MQNFVENTINRIFKTVQISIAKTSRLLLESSDCLQTVFPYQYWIIEILLFILCLVYCNLKYFCSFFLFVALALAESCGFPSVKLKINNTLIMDSDFPYCSIKFQALKLQHPYDHSTAISCAQYEQ